MGERDGAALRRVLGVAAVLVVGALAFVGGLLLRDGTAVPDIAATTTADVDVATPPTPSMTMPVGADVPPCEAAQDVPDVALPAPVATAPSGDLGDDGLVVAVLRTTCGDIELALDADEAPTTVANFVGLATSGYYEGVPFHRVIDAFMIQGGDPTGTGTGCLDADCVERLPGYSIPDELGLAEQLVQDAGGYPRGTLAMANTGAPDSGGSQFFIVQGDPGYALPPSYAVFGRVSAGMDVVDRIAQGPARGDQAIDPVVILGVDVDA